MKKEFLFKLLIDIIYFISFLGIMTIIIFVPFLIFSENRFKIEVINLKTDSLTLTHWLVIIVMIIGYIMFFKGIFHIRRVARFLLTKKYFSLEVILNLKNSGKAFLYSGLLYIAISIVVSITKLFEGNLVINFSFITPLFITSIGLFFILQSNVLKLAKGLKEENALTI